MKLGMYWLYFISGVISHTLLDTDIRWQNTLHQPLYRNENAVEIHCCFWRWFHWIWFIFIVILLPNAVRLWRLPDVSATHVHVGMTAWSYFMVGWVTNQHLWHLWDRCQETGIRVVQELVVWEALSNPLSSHGIERRGFRGGRVEGGLCSPCWPTALQAMQPPHGSRVHGSWDAHCGCALHGPPLPLLNCNPACSCLANQLHSHHEALQTSFLGVDAQSPGSCTAQHEIE